MANAASLAEALKKHGYRIVANGTDNHVLMIDVGAAGLTGQVAEEALEQAGITVNKNTIPYDPQPPMVASGIRIGTPAVTTRGMGGAEMDRIADLIAAVLSAPGDATRLAQVRADVVAFCGEFPLYAAG